MWLLDDINSIAILIRLSCAGCKFGILLTINFIFFTDRLQREGWNIINVMVVKRIKYPAIQATKYATPASTI